MNKEQKWIFDEVMKRLDAAYEDSAGMLVHIRGGRKFHAVRDSCHYVLGLLVRDEKQDRDRAVRILDQVLASQFISDPHLTYYGGFPSDSRRPEPPAEPFPGEHFDAFSRYYLEKWQEEIRGRFLRNLSQRGYSKEQQKEIEQSYKKALTETVPVVWENWDANWREFIITELAMVLIWAEEKLSAEMIERIETAAHRAIFGSIRRWHEHIIPMNTNVELMHVFICGYFGERFGHEEYLQQARSAASDIMDRYNETMSVAEYNSTTYYSVDLVTLAMWRLYLKDETLCRYGEALEAGIWTNIAEMYHPGLHNVCGPYSRNFDNDMAYHSMLPVLFYMEYGEEKPKPLFNCETAGYIEAVLNGTRIPAAVKEQMRTYTGERVVHKQFRELMERGKPGDDTTLCDVSAYIAEDWMLGAMSGSRNTSGQLRSAAAFWKAPDGRVSDMALMRRMPGGRPGEHLWTVYFNGNVDKNHLHMDVKLDIERDIEVFFELHGTQLSADMIQESCWMLPGMDIAVETDAGIPKISVKEADENGIQTMEIVYYYRWSAETRNTMRFDLKFTKKTEIS